MKKWTALFVVCCVFASAFSQAGGIQEGSLEIGLQTALQYWKYDVEGWSDDETALMISGKGSYFVSDNLSVGLSVLGDWMDSGDATVSRIFVELEPNYHFNVESDVVPYVGAHIGAVNYQEDWGDWGTVDETGLSYGVQVGLKSFFSENIALDVQGRYTRYEVADEEADNLSLLLGLNFYF